MASILIGLVVFMAVAYGLRWAWHRFFGAPLDPAAERERLRQDLKRSYRIARWCLKQMLRR
jgi:hypothetical protein